MTVASKHRILFVMLIACVALTVPTVVLPKQDVTVGECPYQVLVIQCRTNFSCGYCGGTLITSRFVITAAHCVVFNKECHLHFGAWKFDQVDEPGRVNMKTDRKNIFRHGSFDPDTLENDLALIKLPYAIKYTRRIQPAKLPVDIKDDLTGRRCLVTGWGKKGDEESLTPILQKQVVSVISNEKCSSYYKSSVFETDMCAQGLKKESVCDGDSGGPLVLENTYILVGVTSYYHGSSCESGFPSGFMRLTKYCDWINFIIKTM